MILTRLTIVDDILKESHLLKSQTFLFKTYTFQIFNCIRSAITAKLRF